MSRFRALLERAEVRINRAFAEDAGTVILYIDAEKRPVTAIFEDPDAPAAAPGDGKFQNVAPALSLRSADINGLKEKCRVDARGESWWVKHIGTDEDGRTRVNLARGEPGQQMPALRGPSRKRGDYE